MGAGGVLPGGGGAAVAGDALGRYAEMEEPLGVGRALARDIDAPDAALMQHQRGQGGGGRSYALAPTHRHGHGWAASRGRRDWELAAEPGAQPCGGEWAVQEGQQGHGKATDQGSLGPAEAYGGGKQQRHDCDQSQQQCGCVEEMEKDVPQGQPGHWRRRAVGPVDRRGRME